MSNSNIELYNKSKENLIRRKEECERRLKISIEKYENIKNSDVDKKEQRLLLAAHDINRKNYALEQLKDMIAFLRPRNDEDIEYRLRQYEEFSKLAKETIPDGLELRFHGCPIYTAKRIIESGEISSSVDRLGIETSYDAEGQISVTTKESLHITVQSYAGLTGNYELPGGCIFVLIPKDEKDAESGYSLLMDNVNFRREPNRLYGIITTPENLENVKKWCKYCNIESEKVYDYDDFLKSLNKGTRKKN